MDKVKGKRLPGAVEGWEITIVSDMSFVLEKGGRRFVMSRVALSTISHKINSHFKKEVVRG